MRHYFNIVEEWKDPIGAEPIKPTPSWMSATFDKLNSRFFHGELPKPSFEVTPLGATTFGQFGFAQSFQYNRRTRMPVDGECDLTKFGPVIKMNAEISRTEHFLEATLLHEMVHWYVDWKYVGIGYGFPKQGHGKEFKAVCDRINRESNNEYALSTKRDSSVENIVKDDRLMDAQERARSRVEHQKCDVIWTRYKDGIEGFIITTPGCTGRIMLEIEDINFMRNHVEWIKYCDDHILGTEIHRMKKFSVSRKYTGYYNISKYPEVGKLLHDNESRFQTYNLQVKENCSMETQIPTGKPIVEDEGDINTIPAGAPIHED